MRLEEVYVCSTRVDLLLWALQTLSKRSSDSFANFGVRLDEPYFHSEDFSGLPVPLPPSVRNVTFSGFKNDKQLSFILAMTEISPWIETIRLPRVPVRQMPTQYPDSISKLREMTILSQGLAAAAPYMQSLSSLEVWDTDIGPEKIWTTLSTLAALKTLNFTVCNSHTLAAISHFTGHLDHLEIKWFEFAPMEEPRVAKAASLLPTKVDVVVVRVAPRTTMPSRDDYRQRRAWKTVPKLVWDDRGMMEADEDAFC